MFGRKIAQKVIQRRFENTKVPELRNSIPSTGPSTGPNTGVNIGSVALVFVIIGITIGIVGVVGKGSLKLTKFIKDEVKETVKPIESKINNVKKKLGEVEVEVMSKIDNVEKKLGGIESDLNRVSEYLKPRK